MIQKWRNNAKDNGIELDQQLKVEWISMFICVCLFFFTGKKKTTHKFRFENCLIKDSESYLIYRNGKKDDIVWWGCPWKIIFQSFLGWGNSIICPSDNKMAGHSCSKIRKLVSTSGLVKKYHRTWNICKQERNYSNKKRKFPVVSVACTDVYLDWIIEDRF